MAQIASLLVPGVNIPQYDGSSWLATLGNALEERGQKKEARQLVQESFGGVSSQQQGGFLAGLKDMVTGQPPQASTSGGFLSQLAPQEKQMPIGVAPVGKVERAALPSGDIYKSFIGTVQAGGVQNPYALAAIASTGSRESGFSADKANATWSDPSQRGAAGTAGGILSWRNERLQNLYRYAASKGEQPGAISPETQAEYFLREDPTLIHKLNTAGSVEEAQGLMNNAWRFAGYDRQGGETAARMARANAYLPEFANRPAQGQPQTAADAIEAIAPLNGAPNLQIAPQAYAEQQAASSAPGAMSQQNFDDRFGPVPLPSEIPAQGVDGLRAGLSQQPTTVATVVPASTAPATYAPPSPALAQQSAPVQVADASGTVGYSAPPAPAGVSPVQVNADLLGRMVTNPYTRDMGIALWKTTVEGRKQGYDFMMAPDGTLLRTDKAGNVEVAGNFAKPGTGAGADEWGLNLVYGKDAEGRTIIGQASKSGKFKPLDVPDGFQVTPGTTNIDTGTAIITRDSKTGQTISTVTKENRQEAADKAGGTVEGRTAAERTASASGDAQAAQNALDLLADIRNDPYRPRGTGMTSVLNAVPGTGGYDFNQKVEQAKSGAFLSAIQQMRGLGALSNTEGQAATAAITRMNASMSEEGFLAALDDYEKIVRQAMERAKSNLPTGSDVPDAETTRGPRPNGTAARPASDDEYNALPSGSLFIDPDDGKTYRKP